MNEWDLCDAPPKPVAIDPDDVRADSILAQSLVHKHSPQASTPWEIVHLDPPTLPPLVLPIISLEDQIVETLLRNFMKNFPDMSKLQ